MPASVVIDSLNGSLKCDAEWPMLLKQDERWRSSPEMKMCEINGQAGERRPFSIMEQSKPVRKLVRPTYRIPEWSSRAEEEFICKDVGCSPARKENRVDLRCETNLLKFRVADSTRSSRSGGALALTFVSSRRPACVPEPFFPYTRRVRYHYPRYSAYFSWEI